MIVSETPAPPQQILCSAAEQDCPSFLLLLLKMTADPGAVSSQESEQ